MGGINDKDLTKAFLSEVIDLLFDDKYVEAVKHVRQAFPILGLTGSKKFVDVIRAIC